MVNPVDTGAEGSEPPEPRIVERIFMVYDAKAGWLSAVKASMMKIVGAGCSLCFVTHGLTGKRKETRALESELGEARVEYLHADEISGLEARRGEPVPLPSVVVELTNGAVVVLMDRPAIDRLRARREEIGPGSKRTHREPASLRSALQFYLAAKEIASPLGNA